MTARLVFYVPQVQFELSFLRINIGSNGPESEEVAFIKNEFGKSRYLHSCFPAACFEVIQTDADDVWRGRAIGDSDSAF